jgi:hydroxypyruvate isomerase
MIKLSGCLEMVFTEIPNFVERIPAAAHAGLDGIEFWGFTGKDLDAIAAACRKVNLPVTAMVVESPEGMLDMHLADKYAEAVQKSISAAEIVGCKRLIATTGNERPNGDRNLQHAGIVACLKTAAPIAEAAGITLVLEPLNILVDHAGYFLSTSVEGFQILEQVSSPAVKLLYDIYHQQVTEGNLIARITSHIDQIGHMHAADVPGRHEPGTGEINYGNVLAAINDSGYEGFVALEYSPSQGVPSADSLKTILKLRDQVNGKG